ncbi:hypothetical protein FRB94_009880 [Tulasnella sp. JGI-2019a]|nr:hypothetical protein FRB94_009880 [Tulasnella sp. JGI-2019a]
MTVLLFSAYLTRNVVMTLLVNKISAAVNVMSATLLVLQLNLYQERTRKRDVDGPPLTTGTTFRFAGLGTPSVTSREQSPTQPSIVTRHRAPMSMVEGQHSGPSMDVAHGNLSHCV